MPDDPMEYFAAVEQHFQRARGTPYFRFSPPDWQLIESWKTSGVPVEAVLRGIDRTFGKMRSRTEKVNSLAFCSREIESEAKALANFSFKAHMECWRFSLDEVRNFIASNAQALKSNGHEDLGVMLESLDLTILSRDLEQLDQQLLVIEERMIARLHAVVSQDVLLEARRDLEHALKPYRGKMMAEQLALLEKQFLERQLLESAGLPRLSLFYLRAD